MKKLYSNIGDKVCKVAQICGIIGVVCAVVGLICLLVFVFGYERLALIPGVVLAILGIASLISSWPLYAFGQITNDVHAKRANVPAKKFSDLPEL